MDIEINKEDFYGYESISALIEVTEHGIKYKRLVGYKDGKEANLVPFECDENMMFELEVDALAAYNEPYDDDSEYDMSKEA